VTRKITTAVYYEALFRHQARITEESNKKPQELLSAVTFEGKRVIYGRYRPIGYAAQTVGLYIAEVLLIYCRMLHVLSEPMDFFLFLQEIRVFASWFF